MLVPEWDLWGESWVLATELSYPGLSWARLLPRGLLYTKRTSSNPAVNPAWPEALLRICRKIMFPICMQPYLLAYSLRLPFGILGICRLWVTAQLTGYWQCRISRQSYRGTLITLWKYAVYCACVPLLFSRDLVGDCEKDWLFLVEFASHEDADYFSIHEDSDQVTTCSRHEDL